MDVFHANRRHFIPFEYVLLNAISQLPRYLIATLSGVATASCEIQKCHQWLTKRNA